MEAVADASIGNLKVEKSFDRYREGVELTEDGYPLKITRVRRDDPTDTRTDKVVETIIYVSEIPAVSFKMKCHGTVTNSCKMLLCSLHIVIGQ